MSMAFSSSLFFFKKKSLFSPTLFLNEFQQSKNTKSIFGIVLWFSINFLLKSVTMSACLTPFKCCVTSQEMLCVIVSQVQLARLLTAYSRLGKLFAG